MRDPSAYPIVMERIGDFTGGNEADNAHAASLMRRPQFVRFERLLSRQRQPQRAGLKLAAAIQVIRPLP